MTKITKVWFDENLGEFRQEVIAANRIWLTREELAARFWGELPHPVYQNIGGQQVGKSQVLAGIQRAMIDSLNDPQPYPYHITADLYDRMKAEGMALGGVTRIEPHRFEFQRPPAAAKTRAALHPLVGALIDRLNEKN